MPGPWAPRSLCLCPGGKICWLGGKGNACLPTPTHRWELPAQLLLSPTLFLLTSLSRPLPTQLSHPTFTLWLLDRTAGPSACVSGCLVNAGCSMVALALLRAKTVLDLGGGWQAPQTCWPCSCGADLV